MLEHQFVYSELRDSMGRVSTSERRKITIQEPTEPESEPIEHETEKGHENDNKPKDLDKKEQVPIT